MDRYFDIEGAIQATDGYGAYQRIFQRWVTAHLSADGKIMLFADYVRRDHPDVYVRALVYARVMGEI
jgi:hypothetical protein